MKTMSKRVVVCLVVVLTILGSGSLSLAEERDQSPAAWLFWHYVARATLNFANGTGEIVGYFTSIDGVPEPLFNGPPSEATAFFSFRADVSFRSLPPNGDVGVTLLNPGTFSVYYSANPNHDWSNPGSFSSGQLVAVFNRATAMQFQIGPVFRESHSAGLASSQDFTFNGQTLNFKHLIPDGVTDTALGSTTPLPGSAFPVFTFAAGGFGVAVGSE